MKDWRDTEVKACDLDTRTANAVRSLGIETLGELDAHMSRSNYIPGVGVKGKLQIEDLLASAKRPAAEDDSSLWDWVKANRHLVEALRAGQVTLRVAHPADDEMVFRDGIEPPTSSV